jgi:hypothetical protein
MIPTWLDETRRQNSTKFLVCGNFFNFLKKNWDTQNFVHLYEAFNSQVKVKIKLTFTITVDSYLVN